MLARCTSARRKLPVQNNAFFAPANVELRALSTVAPSPPAVPYIQRAEVAKGVPQGFGTRHSRSGKTVAVFGGTGFIGGYVVSELALRGHNLVIATRGDDMSWRHLKPCADYGKMSPSYISIQDEESIRNTIKGADIVVNMMGKYYETKHYAPMLINCSYEQVHIDAAETVARVAREEDVKHLVHMSCAWANPNSSSRLSRTKAEGDKRVQEQFPGSVIVKPNVVFGQEDRFISTIGIMNQALPYLPLAGSGDATMRPTYVGDVGMGVAAIASDYATAGQVYSLCGGAEYSRKEIYEYVMEMTRRPKDILNIPLDAALMGAKAINNLPAPWFVPEEVKMWQEDAPGPEPTDKTFAELGMKPAEFEEIAHQFLYRFIEGGHFIDRHAERPVHS